jgi:thiol-disulfide isomerase/thioredoxin
LASPYNRTEYITEGVENLTLLEMIKKHFAGKKILIDLWATWCVPCHLDFQSFNDTFYEFLQNQNISMVFITVDKVSHKSMWEQDVDKISLNGYHLIAPPASTLNNDIRESFYQNEQFYIPRYILVNEKGEILSSTVKKSSDFQFQANILSLLGGD